MLRLLRVVVGAALVVGSPGAAHAERRVTEDARFDVVGLELRDGPPAPVAAPRSASGDIARTVVTHDPDELRIKVWYRGEVDRQHRTTFEVRTPGATYSVALGHDHTGRSVDVWLSRLKGDTGFVRCQRYAAYNDHRVLLGVPTTCLGSPAWVRVGVLDREATRSPDGAAVRLVDDAHRDGAARVGRTRFGPRVHADRVSR